MGITVPCEDRQDLTSNLHSAKLTSRSTYAIELPSTTTFIASAQTNLEGG
jgi:hypothetical protein